MECINLETILNKVNDENVLWNFQVFAKSWEIFAELKINEIKPVQSWLLILLLLHKFKKGTFFAESAQLLQV